MRIEVFRFNDSTIHAVTFPCFPPLPSCSDAVGIPHARRKKLSRADGGGADGSRRARLRHLFAAARGPHRVPRHAGGRHGGQPHHRATAVPSDDRREEGHQFLHQLARRQRHGGAGDLRHDAIHDVRREHVLHRTGGEHGRVAARCGAEGPALCAAELAHHDPPTPRRCPWS